MRLGYDTKERLVNKPLRINHYITAPRLRLIDAEGTQLGTVSLSEALAQAETAGLDLVEIAPQADPPVAKIVDWGKLQYAQTKQQQKAKRKQKGQELKQIRFGLKIGRHDLDIKLGRIRTFLERGSKVKISVFFRGREMAHPELGNDLLTRVVDELQPGIIIDQSPTQAGKNLSMVIRKK